MNHKQIFSVVKRLCPQAPGIGKEVNVYLGVTKTDGRSRHTTVRGVDDIPRKAVVLGYKIELGGASCGFPRKASSINLLATIKVLKKVELIESGPIDVHVDCLECVPNPLEKASVSA